MEFDNNENRLASLWFVGAGIFAVCLGFFIFNVDLYIKNSDREVVRGREMKEVRTAQASFIGSVQDPRIKSSDQ